MPNVHYIQSKVSSATSGGTLIHSYGDSAIDVAPGTKAPSSEEHDFHIFTDQSEVRGANSTAGSIARASRSLVTSSKLI